MKFDYKIIIILLLASILSIWNINSVDLAGDDATYSFRSLGWFDYLAADEQTGPIQWFGYIPAWANFSFHDAPPLVFAIQKIFFTVLGDNPIGARLPFVLSFVATVYVVFLIARELHSNLAGHIGATTMSIMSFGLLAASGGLLEGVEMFFISLAVYFWVKFSKSAHHNFLYFFSAAAGLAILCKYTAFFLPISFLAYLIMFDRKIFKDKHFYFSLILFLAVLFPIIIYNIALFGARGHFDAPFSSFLGQETDDFFTLRDRSAGGNILKSFYSVFLNLIYNISLPLFIMFILSFFYQAYFYFKNKSSRYLRFIILSAFIFTLLFLSLGGAAGTRFLIIFIPIISILIGISFAGLLKTANPFLEKTIIVSVIVALGFEFVYNINSNFLIRPISTGRFIYASEGIGTKKTGYNRLEKYLKLNVLPQDSKLERPVALDKIDERVIANIENNPIIYFFDDSTNWFAYNWYFRKYSNYYGVSMTPFYQQTVNFNSSNVINDFVEYGIRDFYYIHGVDKSVLDPKKTNDKIRESNQKLADMLDQNQAEFTEIKNYYGQVAFRVYKFRIE